jgi:hypothetical protein
VVYANLQVNAVPFLFPSAVVKLPLLSGVEYCSPSLESESLKATEVKNMVQEGPSGQVLGTAVEAGNAELAFKKKVEPLILEGPGGKCSDTGPTTWQYLPHKNFLNPVFDLFCISHAKAQNYSFLFLGGKMASKY